ncbi:hypothetical protein RPT62_001402 [Salmonella enterica]|nr:hypothetical protein [Salmonella enterica]EDT3816764.1 hypothetical protein [Salmonella enterica subsp. enterica serovar Javiana]ECR4553460.1 hypothetical protein [Salmonella enterica]EGD5599968.1 hypothetical protein [Salmonella enterica]EGG9291863.1 hypothetical protein [Salmonella enterica]
MSITVVPFDDTLSAQFRDRVTHYFNCRVWLRDIIPSCVGGRAPSAVTEAVRSAVLAMAFDDFHALVHATAYDSAVSMPAHDGDDLQSVSPMRLLLGGRKDE